MARAQVAFLTLALGTACTTYSLVPVNLGELKEVGRSGVVITTDRPSSPNLGRVRGGGRTWLFGDCSDAAQRAIDELAAQARSRGSQRVTQFRFRGKWKWGREPVCRRNLTYAVLVFPLFFPFPASVTVSGVAE
jgi:hypothetical protein